MPASKQKYLVGLVGPEVLSAIEADSMHPVFLDIEACNALEIRYDFFPVKEWPALSARLRKVAPHAMQIGTIRLKRDGGLYPDHDAYARFPLWSEILKADSVPEWLDLEQDCLSSFRDLENIASLRKTKLLISQHNFLRIPNLQELNDFARDALRFKAPGLKIAAMSNSETDCERLYKFAHDFADDFELFATARQLFRPKHKDGTYIGNLEMGERLSVDTVFENGVVELAELQTEAMFLLELSFHRADGRV